MFRISHVFFVILILLSVFFLTKATDVICSHEFWNVGICAHFPTIDF